MAPTPLAFFKDEIVPLSEARVGVGTHALHYGTAVFEGIRGNWNQQKGAISIFRPKEHYERFLLGCRILRLDIPYKVADLCRITSELVDANGYQEDIYIRPLAFKSEEKIAYLKLTDLESSLAIMVLPLGKYLDVDSAARCTTSSWRRMEDTTIPPRVKISGLYINSILAKTEATLAGFDEAIMLTQDGFVSEGTGENIFLVQNGQLVTPPIYDNVLPGITRDTVIQLAKNELGIETVERRVRRSELYLVDEVFLTGTAAHLTPVGELDHISIGAGVAGPVTKALQDLYFSVIRGDNPKYSEWSVSVPMRK